MEFFTDKGTLLKKLYDISNPIIKYRIDKEFYQKDNITLNQYLELENPNLNYWLNVFQTNKFHGRNDYFFENSIAKLLEFGLTKDDEIFNKKFSFLLKADYWKSDNSFEENLNCEILYPFLIRAGYWNNENVKNEFNRRLEKIEKTIKKYNYDFKSDLNKGPKKFRDEFIFKINSKTELLPTIYDLYAFAFYPKTDLRFFKRIEKVVSYILDERYQSIPTKAYINDLVKKRYYAAGNVYHACMIEERKLLTLFLLSHFKVAVNNPIFNNELNQLLSSQRADGFYELDKALIKEQKNKYYIYSGGHMGLGEKRVGKKWRKIESTFWILKILHNIDKNKG